jgi:hypothetical protein
MSIFATKSITNQASFKTNPAIAFLFRQQCQFLTIQDTKQKEYCQLVLTGHTPSLTCFLEIELQIPFCVATPECYNPLQELWHQIRCTHQ